MSRLAQCARAHTVGGLQKAIFGSSAAAHVRTCSRRMPKSSGMCWASG
jgi:hypothetical protein